jgi:hypothetical protein
LVLVEEYCSGVNVSQLMQRYGFKTKKSVTDKVKKYYPDTYKQIIENARIKRKGYSYRLEKITSEFDAYYLGLLLTDGYVVNNNGRYTVGLDLADEDCIDFLSKAIGRPYKRYHGAITETKENQPRYRLILEDKMLVSDISRFGVIPRKSKVLPKPILFDDEWRFLPYIVRGIIDGDGTVTPTSYGAAQFRVVSASKTFAEWLIESLENRMYMDDISVTYSATGLYVIGTAKQSNILKLISMSYNKPFGMARKYKQIRETFRDYNRDSL